MARLPQPGGDDGQWGQILNDFLGQAHSADGSLKALDQFQIRNLVSDLASKVNATDLKPVATSGSYIDLSDKPTAADIGAVSATDLDVKTATLVNNTSSTTNGAMQAAFGVRPSGTVVYLGDSITAMSGVSVTGANTYFDSRGFTTFAHAFAGQRVNPIFAGVSGETVTQIAARADALIAQRPTFLHILAGTNDMKAGTALATSQAALDSVLDKAAAAGVPVVLGTIPPYQGDTQSGATTAQLDWIEQWNRWLKGMPSSRAGVSVLDYQGVLADPAGGWKSWGTTAYGADGTHPSTGGAARMGRLLADFLNTHLPPLDLLPATNVDITGSGTNPQQVLTNPLMIGTSGAKGTGLSGNVAQGWSVTGEGGATLDPGTGLSKISRTDQLPGEWQQIVNPVKQHTRLQQGPPVPVPGTLFRGAVELQIDGDWSIGDAFRLQIVCYDSSAGFANRITTIAHSVGPSDLTTYPYENKLTQAVLLTPEVAFPANANGWTFCLDHFGTGTVRFGRAALWTRPA